MEARPELVSISFLSVWCLMAPLRLPRVLSQDTAAVSFLCLGRQPCLFLPMPASPALSMQWFPFCLLFAQWHHRTNKPPVPSQCPICVHLPSRFSHVGVCETPWTVARQPPLSLRCSRQEYWSGLPCPPPGDLPNPGVEPVSLRSLALAGG